MRRLIVLATLAISLPAAAQYARNAAYFELGGSAVVPSFNYERRVSERWFVRGGATVVVGETATDTDTTFLFPFTTSWISHPASNHHFELGGGVTIVAGDRQSILEYYPEEDEMFSTVFGSGIVGYRFQRPAGGFQFRAAVTPLVGGGGFLPFAGVSFGYAW